MRISIVDDCQGFPPYLACFGKLAGHEVKVFGHRARWRTARRHG